MSGYRVDPGELFAAEAALVESGQAARAELQRLHAAADDLLGPGWRGAAATAFGRGWSEWADGARTVLAALDEMARALGLTAREYEQTELANATDLQKIA